MYLFLKISKGSPVGLLTVTSDTTKYEDVVNHFFETDPVHSFRRISSVVENYWYSKVARSKTDKHKPSDNFIPVSYTHLFIFSWPTIRTFSLKSTMNT